MSDVREAPVIKVMTGLSFALVNSRISPNVWRMVSAFKRQTCTGGTSDVRRCRSASDTKTSVPVSAIAHCAAVIPMSDANKYSTGVLGTNSTPFQPLITDLTSGESDTAMYLAPD